jgi:hypothetical protein
VEIHADSAAVHRLARLCKKLTGKAAYGHRNIKKNNQHEINLQMATADIRE